MIEKIIWRFKAYFVKQKNKASDRLGYLDTVKAIGIILVVIGHSTYVNENLLTWLVSFHMPLFFVVSGFLFAHNKGKISGFKSYADKRFRGMMIPYFCFSGIYLLIDFFRFAAHLGDISANDIIQRFLQFTSFYGISVMWFLPAIFAAEILLFFVAKKMPPIVQVMIGTAGILLPNLIKPLIETIGNGQMGYFAYYFQSLFLALLRILPSLSFLLTGTFIYHVLNYKKWGARFELFIACLFFIIQTEAAFLNERVDLHFMVFGKPLLFYLGAFAGSVALILLCRHIKPIPALSYLGMNSLIIMATHVDFYVVALGFGIAQVLNLYITIARPYFFAFNLFGIVLLAELILIWLINSYFPWILGRKMGKRIKDRN